MRRFMKISRNCFVNRAYYRDYSDIARISPLFRESYVESCIEFFLGFKAGKRIEEEQVSNPLAGGDLGLGLGGTLTFIVFSSG